MAAMHVMKVVRFIRGNCDVLALVIMAESFRYLGYSLNTLKD